MAPADKDASPPSKQSIFTNFLYFLAPSGLLKAERERRASPRATQRREKVNEIIYPFRAKRAAAKEEKETNPAEKGEAKPEMAEKGKKRVRFAEEEAAGKPEGDGGEGSGPKEGEKA